MEVVTQTKLPNDGNKRVVSKGNLVEGFAWDGNLRKRGTREGPLRDGKGEMVGTTREVNAISNNSRNYKPQKISLKKLNGPKK
jgi:hypothetical protein